MGPLFTILFRTSILEWRRHWYTVPRTNDYVEMVWEQEDETVQAVFRVRTVIWRDDANHDVEVRLADAPSEQVLGWLLSEVSE